MRRVWAVNMSLRIPVLESVFAFKSDFFELHTRIQSSLLSVVTILVTIQCKVSTTVVKFRRMSQSNQTESLSRRLLISGIEGHMRKIMASVGWCVQGSRYTSCWSVTSCCAVEMYGRLEGNYCLHALDSDILNSCQTARRHLSGSRFFVATTRTNSGFANFTSCGGNIMNFREICLAGRIALLGMNTAM